MVKDECKRKFLFFGWHRWLKLIFVKQEMEGEEVTEEIVAVYRRCWKCAKFQIGCADMYSNWVDWEFERVPALHRTLIQKALENYYDWQIPEVFILEIPEKKDGAN